MEKENKHIKCDVKDCEYNNCECEHCMLDEIKADVVAFLRKKKKQQCVIVTNARCSAKENDE